MLVTSDQISILIDIAKEAGAAIMEVYSGEIAVGAKADNSPVTIADLRADTIIRKRLKIEFPGIFILSEESSDGLDEHVDHQTFFLVDPLDGTKEFIKRNGEFTVNIALIHDGQPRAGIVYLPALGTCYFARTGNSGAWRDDAGVITELNIRENPVPATLRVIGSRSHSSPEMQAWLDALQCPYGLVVAGSSLKFCRVAEGQADIYPRLAPTSQWDTAAAQCILEVAGGGVVDANGNSLRYSTARPLLNPWFFAARKEIISQVQR